MFRIAARIVIAVALIAGAAHAALAEKRVALVIGNGAYINAPPLANPKNDAEDMAAALKALGFTVILGIDLDKSAMDRKILAFEKALSGADAGVFHYSGHGLQVAGVNYLVPVDASLESAAALRIEAVRLDFVQETMEREAKMNILFLDACRNNPLARNLARALGTRSAEIGKGLAATEAGLGTLISFSTQPGNVALDGAGRNSPFSGPLAKAILTPGKDLFSILIDVRKDVLAATGGKQVTWDHSALSAPFYFQPGAPSQVKAQSPDEVAALRERLARLEAEMQKKQAQPETPKPAKPQVAVVAPPKPVANEDACDGLLVSVAQSNVRPCIKPGSGESFKDCADCPEMVVVPEGEFTMGSSVREDGRQGDETPQTRVAILKPFAVGRFSVTFHEWASCVDGGGCGGYWPDDKGWGRGDRPVINVSWNDAKAYTAWLSKKTGASYRLPSEAEREYVARARTSTPYWWGSSVAPELANYSGLAGKTVPVKSFKPNPWGLYQVHGNVWEWVEDCYHDTYTGAPTDGSAWTTGECKYRVLRGGSWDDNPQYLRAAYRSDDNPDVRDGEYRLPCCQDVKSLIFASLPLQDAAFVWRAAPMCPAEGGPLFSVGTLLPDLDGGAAFDAI